MKVAKLYEKVSNIRRDNLNKVTTKLIQENQLITVEMLNVKGMMKSHNSALFKLWTYTKKTAFEYPGMGLP